MTAAVCGLQSAMARFPEDDGKQRHAARYDYRFLEELSPGQLVTIGYLENERLGAEAEFGGVARQSFSLEFVHSYVTFTLSVLMNDSVLALSVPRGLIDGSENADRLSRRVYAAAVFHLCVTALKRT